MTVKDTTRACGAAAGCSYVLWGPPLQGPSILLFACPGADPHGRTTRPLSSGFWLGSANGEPWQKLGGEGDSLWPVSPFIGGNLSSHGSLLFVGFFQFPGKGSPPIPRSDGNCSIMVTYRSPSLRLPCALPTPLQTAPQP